MLEEVIKIFHLNMKSEEFCLEKKLKIEYINPEFKEFLIEGYNQYKDNATFHKIKAAEKRTDLAKKYGNNKKKLEKQHLDFIKSQLDNENIRE